MIVFCRKRELRAFLDYVAGVESEDGFVKRVAEAVREAKKNREWRHEYMTLLMRDQENIEKGKSVGEEMMLMLIQKLVDNNRFDEIKKLRIIGNIGRAYTKNTMLEELADLNGNKGHAIVPAHLEGGMSTVHCTAMQLFVLDFDHESTFAQVKRKCDDIWLKITYAIRTALPQRKKDSGWFLYVKK